MASVTENKAKSVFSSVLKEIKPTKNDINSITANVNLLMNRLAKIAGKGVELQVAGSIAKGTNLRGDADIDIFMLCKKGTSKSAMEKMAISYGKKLIHGKPDHYSIKYAEHPYVRLYLNSIGINADLVPATKIESPEELATTVDRTPFHTQFILSYMTDKQKDDTRVLKYLLKAHNIYGAEVKVGGFSGYLCELLIHCFGSLYQLLDYMSNAKEAIVLVPKKKAEGDFEYTKKFNSKFVVIDPVDPNRNVAAGVSTESLSRLIIVSKLFIAKPSESFFYGKKESLQDTRKLLASFAKESMLDIHVLTVKVGNISDDVAWPQLRKAAEMIIDRAQHLGFRIYVHAESIHDGTGIITFLAPVETIGSRIIKGPKASMGKAPLKFIEAHRNAHGFIFDKETVNALERNGCSTFGELLTGISRGKQVILKKGISLKGAKVFANSGIPKEYSDPVYIELREKLRI